MTQKMNIHWDAEGDHLEVRFGKSKPSYYEDVGNDIFERRDEETNKIIGYAFFNVLKRKKQFPQDIEVDLPTGVEAPVSS
jgi:hypothetical protein